MTHSTGEETTISTKQNAETDEWMICCFHPRSYLQSVGAGEAVKGSEVQEMVPAGPSSREKADLGVADWDLVAACFVALHVDTDIAASVSVAVVCLSQLAVTVDQPREDRRTLLSARRDQNDTD